MDNLFEINDTVISVYKMKLNMNLTLNQINSGKKSTKLIGLGPTRLVGLSPISIVGRVYFD